MTTEEEAFYKQRGKLIAASLLVIFINSAGGEISKLNFLGNEITFSRPEFIHITFAAALIYFMIRYLQFSHDVKNKGFVSRFQKKAETYIGPYLMKREFNRKGSDLSNNYKSLDEIKLYEFIYFNEAMPARTAAASFVGKRGGVVIDCNELKLISRELIIPYGKSSIYVIFSTRLGTDYILPIIIAVIAFASYLPQFRASLSQWL